jgi:aspartate aminotransferase
MKSMSISISQGTFVSHLSGMLERTITVNGVAKAFAMTGWRIGYIERLNSSQSMYKNSRPSNQWSQQYCTAPTITAVDADLVF